MRPSELISSVCWGLLPLANLALAQFPPEPEGIKVLRSKFDNNVTISYKETDICETTPGVHSYAGYVSLPPGSLTDLGEANDYPINTFFWFFEARKDPLNAPLSIWMNGGPGSSSMLGLFVENGPCFVNPDSNSTYLSDWSWNNEVNMLYLDQPVQVGLSYDGLQNVTLDLLEGDVTLLNDTDPIPDQNSTFLVGTYPSRDSNRTSLGTENAAIALWHFAQTWFQEFPGYHPNDSRISIATESYGGRYGPAFAAFFEEQNQRIENGSWSVEGEQYVINLDTLMIINGCIDRPTQWPGYPMMAYNNTYGIESVNETIHEQMLDALYREGGCLDQIEDCRAISVIYDPENIGINETVNEVCQEAENFCSTEVRGPYLQYSGRNYYDIATLDPDPFPAPFYQGYLNQPHVQAALGVPLNWTQSNGAVSSAFRSIGDYVRPGWIEDLAYLLENGIKVTLAYGDRDYACNWYGGELLSLAINYTHTADFHAAGYADIQTNASYVGGQVRQYGNLSFSRVYQAGHEIPSYQPETAYRIFMRALFNRDIATGEESTASGGEGGGEGETYSTTGPSDTLAITNEPPAQPVQFCYTLDAGLTCTEEELERLSEGSAIVDHFILVDCNSTQLFPEVVGGSNVTDGACGEGMGYGIYPAGNGTGGSSGGNGTVSPGNGTVGPSATPSPYTGGAGALQVPLWVALWGVLVAVL
ncbi:Carboxypeptidase S1 [Hortaea werneckii]|uniref:Carboxypeptidase n=1 Tax=Hortaea werneckii EXF-2000 TaxID=1157616 RepID=A0A1Z5TMM7_HORWE|nr:Carboxypeptidase S1 [Hortaea werneckii]OTA37312.1 Carboxypeptidase S1 B [Hortaea werneckii EXF-2000]KAI6850640.1 Carboxypeptidase S1 [Hortaea werneckii]KAI6929543.1 Carboxypeptidase S1 [Hortaea werneckii]KAI6947449.1 Carboxypeptidase S1 [Hortaea werneckii]